MRKSRPAHTRPRILLSGFQPKSRKFCLKKIFVDQEPLQNKKPNRRAAL
jgi:hypothetical protein